jgi:antirestriction protein
MSNSNYNLSLNVTVTYQTTDETFDSVDMAFDPYNDCTDMQELEEYCKEQLPDYADNILLDEDEEPKDIRIEITNFDEVPSKYANEKDVWKFAEAFAECSYEIEVVEAALECDINASDIDEAYQGKYDSDEDFAEDMAEQLDCMPKNLSWPLTCIDWERAAKELMYDYSESDGHYFRRL